MATNPFWTKESADAYMDLLEWQAKQAMGILTVPRNFSHGPNTGPVSQGQPSVGSHNIKTFKWDQAEDIYSLIQSYPKHCKISDRLATSEFKLSPIDLDFNYGLFMIDHVGNKTYLLMKDGKFHVQPYA